MNLAPFLTIFLFFVSKTFSIKCYFYRVRADEGIAPEAVVVRNCSTSSNWCVKIIARNEITGTDSDTSNSIEGRCAFSSHECEGRQHKCTPEAPIERYGITIHEHKCCSNTDLSNKSHIFLCPTLLLSYILYTCI